MLKSGRVGATVPNSLSNPVINDLREKYLTASKTEAQLESKLGAGHLQVINLNGRWQEFERLIFEELQRIGESYRSEAEVARAKEQSLNVSMSGLVGESAQTNETLVQLRELERESETYRTLYQTFMQRYQEALQQQSFPDQRGARHHRGDAADDAELSQAWTDPGAVARLRRDCGLRPRRAYGISRSRVPRRRSQSATNSGSSSSAWCRPSTRS